MAGELRFEFFESVIESLYRGPGYVVQIVHAFFDESGTHAGSPVLCVAGYVFSKRNARLLSREWEKVLRQFDLPYFHMVDCAHGNGVFARLTMGERIAVQTRLIDSLKQHAAYGFGVSIDTKAYSEVLAGKGPTMSAYAFCARCVIDEIGRWFHQTGFRGKSAYLFEAGHESWSEADQVVRAVLTNPLNKLNDVHYGYKAHSFIEKQESPPVQAADILAWQWATDIKHQMGGRPRRKDFASLLELPHKLCHFDENRTRFFLSLTQAMAVPEGFENSSLEDQLAYIRTIGRARELGLSL